MSTKPRIGRRSLRTHPSTVECSLTPELVVAEIFVSHCRGRAFTRIVGPKPIGRASSDDPFGPAPRLDRTGQAGLKALPLPPQISVLHPQRASILRPLNAPALASYSGCCIAGLPLRMP